MHTIRFDKINFWIGKGLVYFGIIFFVAGCSENPKSFSIEAYNDVLLDIKGNEITWEKALNEMKGSKTFIDFWATWCKDCIENFEVLEDLQQEFPNVNFVFVSLDNNIDSWNWGIEKYNLVGSHYFLPEGKNGALGDFLNLWWIPRYVVIDENNNILIFKATSAEDIKIKNVLQ
ncbi:TlpA family protein disulfide reductase [Aegicerativicinus sediminis]